MQKMESKSLHGWSLARHTLPLAFLVFLIATWATIHTSNSIVEEEDPTLFSSGFQHRNITFDLTIRDPNDDSDPNWYTGPDPNNTPYAQLDAKGKMIHKGNRLLCMMRASIGSPLVEDTPFHNPSSLAANGWSLTQEQPYSQFPHMGLNPAAHGVGISANSRDWARMKYDHDEDREIDGTTYPHTWAEYTNVFCPTSGAVVGEINYGPPYWIQKGLSDGPPPPLARWSDVVFLAWKTVLAEYPQLGGDLSNIQHIFHWSLGEEGTQKKLQDITGKTPYSYGAWPGMSFPIDSNQAKALLTVDNNLGAAWLLSQHKDTMGIKAVDRIQVFNSDGEGKLCLYLHISDVPPEQRV